jgi:hypothetical protein
MLEKTERAIKNRHSHRQRWAHDQERTRQTNNNVGHPGTPVLWWRPCCSFRNSRSMVASVLLIFSVFWVVYLFVCLFFVLFCCCLFVVFALGHVLSSWILEDIRSDKSCESFIGNRGKKKSVWNGKDPLP